MRGCFPGSAGVPPAVLDILPNTLPSMERMNPRNLLPCHNGSVPKLRTVTGPGTNSTTDYTDYTDWIDCMD